jgi:hypothetical protein
MDDRILRPESGPDKPIVSLFEYHCRSQGRDPAAVRAEAAAAARRYCRASRAVVNGSQAASRHDLHDTIAVVQHLVLTQERERAEDRRALEVALADVDALHRELALVRQELRHLVEDLPDGIREVLAQALDDRDRDRDRDRDERRRP